MNREVRSNILAGWWFDTGTKDSILKANSAALDNYVKKDIQVSVDSKSSITGLVAIKLGVEINNSHIEVQL